MERKLGTNAKKAFCMAAAMIMLLIVCAPPVADAAAGPPRITVNQVFTTSGRPDAFTYRLEPLETGSPMPEGSTEEGYTFTITGTDSVTIEMTPYSREGVYRYKLYQVIGAAKTGYTYDKKVYTVEIHVYEELYIIVVVYNEDGTKAGAVTFRNSYSGGGTTITPPTDPPTTDPPPTDKPTICPPTTELPEIEPPTTELPEIEPPATELPEIEPPLTELPPTDSAGGGKDGSVSPKTSDETNYELFYWLFVSSAVVTLVAAVCLIVGGLYGRRRRQK